MAELRDFTSKCGNYTVMVSAFDKSEHPVIVIGGWAGAQDKNLKKYAEFLADHGFTSIRSVLPLSALFSPISWPRRNWAIAVLEFMREQGIFPSRSLVFYSFSNGGAMVNMEIDNLAKQPKYSMIPSLALGFIFDSAPAYFNDAKMGKKVLQEAMPPTLTGKLTSTLMIAVNSLTPLFHSDWPAEYWQAQIQLGWNKPQLFLYSMDDHLCNAVKLEELIERKSNLGQPVSSLRWEHSRHCGHFKLHHEEYSERLIGFLLDVGARGSGVRVHSKL